MRACVPVSLAIVLLGTSAPALSPVSMRDVARDVAASLVARAERTASEGRTIEAEALYRRAIDADSTAVAGYLGYARMLGAQGQCDEARAVLVHVPTTALERVEDRVQLARALAATDALDEALVLLARETTSVEAVRASAELAANGGRLPEALRAARQLATMVPDATDEARNARRLVRALGVLVGETDAVNHPGDGAGALRRRLAR